MFVWEVQKFILGQHLDPNLYSYGLQYYFIQADLVNPCFFDLYTHSEHIHLRVVITSIIFYFQWFSNPQVSQSGHILMGTKLLG